MLSTGIIAKSAQFSNRSRRGFTLTEIAIVLGIIGLILGAVWVAASAVYQNLKLSRASQQLVYMANQIRSMHANSAQIDTAVKGLSDKLYGTAVYPTDMVKTGTAGTANPWNPTVTTKYLTDVSSENDGATDGQAFGITFRNVPEGACVDFIVRNTQNPTQLGLLYIGTGAGTTPTTTGAAPASAIPIATNGTGATVAQASGACTAAVSTAKTVDIGFVYSLKN